jgi:hypothetical protein
MHGALASIAQPARAVRRRALRLRFASLNAVRTPDKARPLVAGGATLAPTAVAVPVINHSGVVVASLSLSGPTVRFPDENVAQLAADLDKVATRQRLRGQADGRSGRRCSGCRAWGSPAR